MINVLQILRRHSRMLPLAAVCGILALGGAVVVLRRPSSNSSVPLKAAIIDQLSLTQPNPQFRDSATQLLQAQGYTVDYVPGQDVTVDYYRALATHHYQLIIFRTHAATFADATPDRQFALLFTNEPFRPDQHTDLIRKQELAEAVYDSGSAPLFAVPPAFFEDEMPGRFSGTQIVMMGCNGLEYPGTAQAFFDKGASAFVSWDRKVTPEHTDAATEKLLHYLLVEHLPLAESTAKAAHDVGPDPAFGAVLRIATP